MRRTPKARRDAPAPKRPSRAGAPRWETISRTLRGLIAAVLVSAIGIAIGVVLTGRLPPPKPGHHGAEASTTRAAPALEASTAAPSRQDAEMSSGAARRQD